MRNFEIYFREPMKHSFSHLLVKKIVKIGCSAKKLFPVYQRALGGWIPPPRISACRRDRNEIPTATPMFSGSSNSVEVLRMLSDQTGSRKSNHQAAILDFRLPIYVTQHSDYFHWVAGPRTHGCSLWNFVPIPTTSWDLSTSGLEAAILDFRLPVWSDSI